MKPNMKKNYTFTIFRRRKHMLRYNIYSTYATYIQTTRIIIRSNHYYMFEITNEIKRLQS